MCQSPWGIIEDLQRVSNSLRTAQLGTAAVLHALAGSRSWQCGLAKGFGLLAGRPEAAGRGLPPIYSGLRVHVLWAIPSACNNARLE